MASASPSNSPEPVAVPAGRVVCGRLRLPASKSLTQRYFNLALLGRTPLTVESPLLAEDTEHFLGALAACGFRVHQGLDPEGLAVLDLAPGTVPAAGEIFCGAGGTMLRFLTAALTVVPGRWRLDGIPRLRERPLGPLIAALRQLGAEISCPEREGFAPLDVVGATLRGGRATLDAGASSQFLSALLMAAQAAPAPTTVEVAALTSEPYVDLTLDAIAELGGDVERVAGGFEVRPPARLTGGRVRVEADFSAAAYPAAAAALTGGLVELWPLARTSRQGDRRFVDLLAEMGAEVRWQGGALVVRRRAERLRAVDADLSAMPDQVPTLAALAPFAAGTTRIRNVPHLRLKESDRLSAMASELRRVGAEVEELADGLVVPGVWAERRPPEDPVEVATYGDHRIAMSMALVGLRRPGLRIREPQVVGKSYPAFWRDLQKLIAG